MGSRNHALMTLSCDNDDQTCDTDSLQLAACEAAACSCRPMVERAYRELVDKGQPGDHALASASVVLRWHHPEVPAPEAVEIVARWVTSPPIN